jgi:hypothetical protein
MNKSWVTKAGFLAAVALAACGAEPQTEATVGTAAAQDAKCGGIEPAQLVGTYLGYGGSPNAKLTLIQTKDTLKSGTFQYTAKNQHGAYFTPPVTGDYAYSIDCAEDPKPQQTLTFKVGSTQIEYDLVEQTLDHSLRIETDFTGDAQKLPRGATFLIGTTACEGLAAAITKAHTGPAAIPGGASLLIDGTLDPDHTRGTACCALKLNSFSTPLDDQGSICTQYYGARVPSRSATTRKRKR